jgi:crossover junction endodeoxyribonuclease RuvC
LLKNNLLLQKKTKIILGIDPGTLLMGYGLIEAGPSNMVLIEMNVLRLSPRADNYERLRLIQQKVQELIDKFHPDHFAIEAPFFGKNVQSMLKLGRAQGVAIATAMHSRIPVTEYSPKKVKQSITGNGNAAKEQVWKMLQQLLQIREDIKSFDASDALAVALCHHFQGNSSPEMGSGRVKGWSEFIARNPGRVG